ncbi:unnamed protein product [Rotaria sp. Silwood2]|nr:unnamed protein product [Rotaria sp. Silwood2]CAF4040732.1 unnamed protein product [Rotaria sp. Silwood2]
MALINRFKSRKSSLFNPTKNQTNSSPYLIKNNIYDGNFILQLSKVKHIKEILNNTSGYLDLTAVNDQQVYSKIDYQSYRLFPQSTFLTIQHYNKKCIEFHLTTIAASSNGFNKYLPIATNCINRMTNTPRLSPNTYANISKVTKDEKAFEELYQTVTGKDN